MFFVIKENIKVVQQILEKEADVVKGFCHDTCHDDNFITMLINDRQHEQALQFLNRHRDNDIECRKLSVGL